MRLTSDQVHEQIRAAKHRKLALYEIIVDPPIANPGNIAEDDHIRTEIGALDQRINDLLLILQLRREVEE